MNSLVKSKKIAVLVAPILLAGCAQYLNHNDSVTLGAGNAPQANLGVHTIEPFPPRAGDTNIKISGKKTEDALDRYNQPGDPSVVGAGAAENITLQN